ncbi:hypothetical protein Rsub_08735 [Raphidocelis subcapitata]|uniref:RAP domain-containing protein n=1 Tax=Raphidocelis subcapitata TaxID=307507 RepID=A0A2V0PE71_9CHLO|nr:hypothetical protein Rsub_08735 [Raphidocelis subcapitata]|eukprot:GBF96190.1 hypothetical protein Rsub_08735 [Raphidocelis subcapitata]
MLRPRRGLALGAGLLRARSRCVAACGYAAERRREATGPQPAAAGARPAPSLAPPRRRDAAPPPAAAPAAAAASAAPAWPAAASAAPAWPAAAAPWAPGVQRQQSEQRGGWRGYGTTAAAAAAAQPQPGFGAPQQRPQPQPQPQQRSPPPQPPAALPTAAAALLQALRAAGGGDAALSRLARAAARAPAAERARLADELSGLLESDAPIGGGAAPPARLEGAPLCHALWVVARAGGAPAAALRRLFGAAVPAAYSSLGALGPDDLARLLTAYAAAGAYSQELFAAATEFVWDALPRMPPARLAEVAVAYASAGHYDNDEDLWSALADRAAARVNEFEPHQLAALLESAARLRFRHSPLCSAALGAAAHGAQRWPTAALAQVVWALGWLGHGVGPGEGPQLDRIAATVATRLRNLMTSTDVTRVVAAGVPRVPGSGALGGDGNGGGGNGGGGNGGFLGTSREAAALTAGPYRWQPGSGDGGSSGGGGGGGDGGGDGSGGAAGRRDAAWGPPRRQTLTVTPGLADSFDFRAGAAFEAARARAASDCSGSEADDDEDRVRPALDSPAALRDSLARLAWGFTALGRIPSALLRESFKLLGSFPATDFSQPQLALLYEAGARAVEIAHGPLDTHPLMATSWRVFTAETKRAPRMLALSPGLQGHAFAAWLRGTCHGRAPLAPPPMMAAAAPRPRGGDGGQRAHPLRGGPVPEPEWPDPGAGSFSSWRFRDPASTSRAGLEASISETLASSGLSKGSPASPELTLDGVLQVALPLVRGNARIAVEPLAPEAATRNPPHAPLGPAGTRSAMLRYRGWGVAPVLFSDWAQAGEHAGAGGHAALLEAGVEGAEAEAACRVAEE